MPSCRPLWEVPCNCRESQVCRVFGFHLQVSDAVCIPVYRSRPRSDSLGGVLICPSPASTGSRTRRMCDSGDFSHIELSVRYGPVCRFSNACPPVARSSPRWHWLSPQPESWQGEGSQLRRPFLSPGARPANIVMPPHCPSSCTV